jgi:biopolymer transport protein ExbB/TolQ
MFKQHQKRIQRAYTTVVVVITTAAGAYAIGMRAASERASARRADVARLEAEARRVKKHADETNAQFANVRREYSTVVRTASRHEKTMLRDLAAAQRAARRTGTNVAAPLSYSTSVQTSFASAAPVSSAASSAPTSGTS